MSFKLSEWNGAVAQQPVDMMHAAKHAAERMAVRDTLGSAIRALTPLAAKSIECGRALKHAATALRWYNEACANEDAVPVSTGHRGP